MTEDPQDYATLLEALRIELAAWKEAYESMRGYYWNNDGPSSRRYREAVARLKELKLIK